MTIKHWPEAERPREKLLLRGGSALSDAELLAIFFRTGVAGRTALDLARELLLKFRDVRALLDCEYEEFTDFPGMGAAKYAQLQAALELGRRYWQTTLQRQDALYSPSDTKRYLSTRLRDYPHEVFACLFLDNKHRITHYEELFTGTINSTVVHPRIVLKQALKYNAVAVILAHNHPSGDPAPSQADYEMTQHLKQALALVEIQLLDHMIVGDTQTLSLAELDKI